MLFSREISHGEAHEIQGLERDVAQLLTEKAELEAEVTRLNQKLADSYTEQEAKTDSGDTAGVSDE